MWGPTRPRRQRRATRASAPRRALRGARPAAVLSTTALGVAVVTSGGLHGVGAGLRSQRGPALVLGIFELVG